MKSASARSEDTALKAVGYDKQLWVVDESSMVSSRDLYALLKAADSTRARVLLVGDVKQLPAVEAGKPFAQLQRGGMAVAVMQDILRQTQVQALAAVKESIAGKARAALTRIKDTVYEIQDKEHRLQAIAQHYLSLSPQDRDQTLVLSPANEDRVVLNALIRAGLQQAGVLAGDKVETIVYVNQGLTRVEKARASSYQQGDVVRFQRAYRTLDVGKGEYARVVGIEQHAGVVKLQTLAGRAIAWQPGKVAGAARRSGVEVFKAQTRDLMAGDRVRWTRNDKNRALRNAEPARVVKVKSRQVSFELSNGARLTVDITRPENRHWEHAYTSTVYSAQGQTAMTVLVNGEDFRRNLTNQKTFYVALSRAKEQIHVYVNDREGFIRAVEARSGDKTAALEALQRESQLGKDKAERANNAPKLDQGLMRKSGLAADGLGHDAIDYKQYDQRQRQKQRKGPQRQVDKTLDR